MKKLLFLTALLVLNGTLFAQFPPCATDSLQYLFSQNDSFYYSQRLSFGQRINDYRQNTPTENSIQPGDPSASLVLGCRTTRYIIPVVFHINHDPLVQVSDTQIYQQLQILNDAFQSYNIQFCIAKKRPNGVGFNGINRFSSILPTTNNELSAQLSSLTQSSSGNNYFNPAHYLNIYVVKEILENGQVSTLAAYNNSYPWQNYTDAIVIRHDRLGDNTACYNCGNLATDSRGKVLIHEVGHYLGLFHTFEGSCTGGNTATTCDKEGDLCCDTRPVLDKGTSCSIDTSVRTCPSYHLSIIEDRTNYMDYSGEQCINHFSPDQVSILHASLELYRPLLIRADNVNNLAANCCAGSAWFDADNNVLCPGDSIRFSGYEYNITTHYYWDIFHSGDTVSYFDTMLTQYSWAFTSNDTGSFDIRLRIVNATGDTIGITRYGFLQIKDCGTLLPSTQGSWYFGDHAGLLFSSSGVFKDIEPSIRQPNINSTEGTISQSDTAGNLLFYGGVKAPDDLFNPEFHFQLFNSDYAPMSGGRIKGDPSSAQGGLVLPVPGNSDRYYLISSSGSSDGFTSYMDSMGLRYSIIDMTLNSGLGDIDPGVLNVPVMAPTGSGFNPLDSAFYSGEYLTAIPKCGSDEYWLITNDYSPSGFANRNKLMVFSVDSTGITFHDTSDFTLTGNGGLLKASPNGRFLAMPGLLASFDRSSGSITYFRDLSFIAGTWGLSFSPDSRKLYLLSEPYTNVNLIQLDLESTTSNLSAITVSNTITTSNDQMQLGPDGKIYLSQAGKPSLGVIHSPDIASNAVQQNACNYEQDAVAIQSGGLGGTSEIGLPNFVDAKKQEELALDFLVRDSACGTVTFLPNNLCAGSYHWSFGDGDTSFLAEPTHIYSEKDSFEVTLTLNGSVQVSRKIKIGLDRPLIAGDTLVCDTSIIVNYAVQSPNPYFFYSWTSNEGDVLIEPSSPYGVRIHWHEQGDLILKALNDKNGCIAYDTLSPQFNFIDSNYIENDQLICNGFLPNLIFGDSATATLGGISYSWQKQIAGGGWQNLDSSNSQHFQPDSLGNDTILFRRRAHSGSCISYSDTFSLRPVIQNNLIIDTSNYDFLGCQLELLSSIPDIAGDTTPSYLWFYSYNNSIWDTVPDPFGELPNLYYDLDADSLYFFRQVKSVVCTSYSDTVAISPRVKITQQPQNFMTCNNRVFFNIKVDNPYQIPLQFLWNFYSDPDQGSYTGTPILHTGDSLDYVHPTDFDSYFQCEVSSSSCAILSDWAAYIRNPNSDTTVIFIQQPYAIDTILYEWDSATIIVKDSSSIHISETFNKKYSWEFSYDDSIFFPITPAVNNDTLIDNELIACNGKKFYRVKIQVAEDCSSATSQSTGVLPYKNSNLWAKDSPIDTGGEPNSLSIGNYWSSQDIWNNTDPNSYSSNHQNPEYKTLSPNKIFVRVRNKGEGYNKPASLYLYWTLPSTREDWPDDWKYNLSINSFYNQDNFTSYPLGSEINDTAILIGPLAPDTDTVVSFNWYPPNPNWYYTYVNGNKEYYSERMLCFLSRIVECDISPYGMAAIEVVENTVNVKNNNNIITKNVTVKNTSQTDYNVPIKTYYPVVIGRNYDLAPALTLKLSNLGGSSYFDYGEVSLILDDSLYAAWVAGGEQGYGFSADGNVISVTDISTFQLNNIITTNSNDMQAIVVLEFNSYPLGLPVSYSFRFTQYSGTLTEPDGGVYFEGLVPGYVPSVERNVLVDSSLISNEQSLIEVIGVENQQSEINKTDSSIFSSYQAKENSIKAFPVPFSERVNIEFSLSTQTKVGFILLDGSGKRVKTINTLSYTEGVHRVILDASDLAPGVYLCQVSMGDSIEYLRLVIAR